MISYTGDIKFGIYTSAPLGWKMCDGTNGTPDFRGAGPIGSGSGFNVGQEGGAASVSVPLPQHDHPFSGSSHNHSFSGSSHTHGFSPQSHNHSFSGAAHSHAGSGGQIVVTGGSGAGLSGSGTSGHGVSFTNTTTAGGSVGSASADGTIASASTSGSVGSATTSGSVGNAGTSGASISTRSPYVVCLAIQKI